MRILDNGIAVIASDTHISRWVEQEGRLDHDRTIELSILPHINEGDWVVDCGANIGSHTIPYAVRVGEKGRVSAFEVNNAALECLMHNSKPYPQITVHSRGLSDRFETLTLIPDVNAGASFVGQLLDPMGYIVKCVPLDSLTLPRLHFIKVDCEGYELFALRGAWRTIKRYRPKLFVEVNPGALARNHITPSDLTDFLDLFNYNYEQVGDSSEQHDLLCLPR